MLDVIKVYALSTCPWCKKVKKLLEDNNIQYDFIDVDLAQGEEQQKALAEVEKLTGRRSFPVTVINDQVIEGFKKEELKEALSNEK
ncbi:MAG TPA: glutaredoxin family protein [Firmicutes bacterium]|nr:glutaredoxin family protein [Bacillota bacterium]